MLGGSDAGAHLDRMAGAPFPTRFLGDMLRGRKLVSLRKRGPDDHRRPGAPVRSDGRGYLREGYIADITVFDPETIASEDASLVKDLPGDSARLTAASVGMSRSSSAAPRS